MLIDDITKLNRSSQNSIFAALVVIAAVGIYKWVFTPHANYLYAAQQYDFAVSKMVDENEAISNKIEVETKKLKELSEQLTQTEDKLFTPEEAKDFFGSLQTIFEETGCMVHSLNLVADKPGDKKKQSGKTLGIVANSARLSISGQYSSIIKMVEGLQSSSSMVSVDSFEMEVVDFRTGQLRCDMTITIYIIQNRKAGL